MDLRAMNYRVAVFLWMYYLISMQHGQTDDRFCPSPQYLELGQTETIYCNVRKDFFRILWYDSTRSTSPIIYLSQSGKEGGGYTSGEFDVCDNGALIVNNVSLKHEHYFWMFLITSLTEDTRGPYNVRVVVTVKPSQMFPFIESCDQDEWEPVFYMSIDQASVIICFVHGARPAVNLTWWNRTYNGDIQLSHSDMVVSGTQRKTTNATTTLVLNEEPRLLLLVCIANTPPKLLTYNESVVLIENLERSFEIKIRQTKYAHYLSVANISCSDTTKRFLVWRKYGSLERDVLLAYAVFDDVVYTKSYRHRINISEVGSLVLYNIQTEDEGMFVCIYGDGVNDGIEAYNVSVYMLPTPAYLIVKGCNNQQYCVIEGSAEGILTCSVKNIRPVVILEWRVLRESTRNAIIFSDWKVEEKQKGIKHDVTLTARYQMIDRSVDRLTLECRTTGQHAHLFNLSTKLDLLVKIEATSTTYNVTAGTNRIECRNMEQYSITFNLLVAVAVFIVFFISVYILLKVRRVRKHRKSKRNQHNQIDDILQNNARITDELVTLRRILVPE